MNDINNFETLKSKYIIRGFLTNMTQLHIGTGEKETEFSPIDNPIITLSKDGEEIPYIPGSSLKGVLRTEVERYLRTEGEHICYPYEHKSPCNDGKIEDICYACQMFGCQQIGSHIYISDAILNTEEYSNPGIRIKPGNAIDRITGAAKSGALYQIETIQPGGFFSFEIQIFNINLKDDSNILTRAIKFVLKELKEGWISIGGKRSTGLGQIKIHSAEVIEITPESLKTLEFEPHDLNDYL